MLMLQSVPLKMDAEEKQQSVSEKLAQISLPTSPRQFYRRPLPSSCISFSSKEGQAIFAEALAAGHMVCYFGLASQFRTQDEPAYCGLSTLVMVLNTLEVDPMRVWKGPWRWYHENMLDCCLPLQVVEEKGITMDQFRCLAECNMLSVRMTRAEGSASEEEFREHVIQVSQDTSTVIVASYSRRVLEQTGSGHFSPIGGYHPTRDLVLILDTARFKYPPHWVPLSLLWKAMKDCDRDTGKARGYYLLDRQQGSQPVLFKLSSSLSIVVPNLCSKLSETVSLAISQWHNWLCSPHSAKSQSADDTWLPAIGQLLSSVKNIQEDEVLLTTHIDVSCPQSLSCEHTCAVKQLIGAIENTVLYERIKSYCSEGKCEYFLMNSIGKPNGLTTCKLPGTESALPVNSKCTKALNLKGQHFLAIFLLSWPYRQGSGATNADHLGTLIYEEMSSAVAVLQNETRQLKQQLTSLLRYMNKCQSCDCRE